MDRLTKLGQYVLKSNQLNQDKRRRSLKLGFVFNPAQLSQFNTHGIKSTLSI